LNTPFLSSPRAVLASSPSAPYNQPPVLNSPTQLRLGFYLVGTCRKFSANLFVHLAMLIAEKNQGCPEPPVIHSRCTNPLT
jgi:hypothetical protein